MNTTQLIPVYVDVETFVSKTVTLKRQTLRGYLAASRYTAIAIAVGDEEVRAYEADAEGALPVEVEHEMQKYAVDPRYVFVAHNAAFDIRVLNAYSDVPFPKNVWCTWEGAMGAWPELPGGYGLKGLCKTLNFPAHLQKLEIDLLKCTPEELVIYNKRDVEVMRYLYKLQMERIPELEKGVALRTHQQRQFKFRIASDKMGELLSFIEATSVAAETRAKEFLNEHDVADIFNRDEGPLHSIRSARLLKVVQEKMGLDTDTTSLKKINPIKLAINPEAAGVLACTSLANKMLSHKRRVKIYTGINQVDVELGYMRAHTGRFSSPSTGKGLNLHNMPKHDKSIAEPVRKMYRLEPHLCAVRADLANVEYRVEGKLTSCKTVLDMFNANPFSDPYCGAWHKMTNQLITKSMPVRQVAKAAVLGLGFGMGPAKFITAALLPAVAEGLKTGKGVTEQDFINMAVELGWRDPLGDKIQYLCQRTGCSKTIARAGFHIHRAFNAAHQEFDAVANWLFRAVESVASAGTKERAKELIAVYNRSVSAPESGLLQLKIDDDILFARPSIRATCGPWVPTVCWREPKLRTVMGEREKRVTILKAHGEPKPVTKQLLIENVTQAAARNGLCWLVAELDKMGFGHVIHIHDEIMIICERKADVVLKAREAMIEVVKNNPMGWAVFIDPKEITVTESMYESADDIDVKMGNRWARIERNEAGCLEDLP